MKSNSEKTYKLLQLLSRFNLTTCHESTLFQLLQEVEDWDIFLLTAKRKFGLASINRSYSELSNLQIPKEVLREIQSGARNTTMRMLKANAANVSFHEKCIRPLSAKHFYIKGPSLWARYYDKNHARNCRDIDVVVHKQHFAQVIELAQRNGYRILSETMKEVDYSDEQYLRAIARYQNVVTILSPEGIPIELHKRVDKTMGVFSSRDLFNDLDHVELGAHSLSVLPTSKLAVYICFHSTQHLWSHLSWITDFDAIIHDKSFDHIEAQKYAEKIGLGRLWTGCCSFFELMGRPDLQNSLPEATIAMSIHKKSIASLAGNLDNEHQMTKAEWQMGARARYAGSVMFSVRTSLNSFFSIFKPQISLYDALPLPDRLQFLYFPLTFIEHLGRGVLKLSKRCS